MSGVETSPGPPTIRLRGLLKSFGDAQALRGIDLDVDGPQVLGVVGPDGAGKTTLLRCLAGLLEVRAEEAFVLGHDLRGDVTALKAGLGYVPQAFSLYRELSVHENLQVTARLNGIEQRDFRARVEPLLERTGLAPFVDRQAGALSGGMKQKLAIVSALLPRPRLILLDEPTAGVDVVARDEIWSILRERKHEVLVVVSTSYLEEVEDCDRLVYLDGGRAIANGTPGELRARVPLELYRAWGANPRAIAEAARSLPWVSAARTTGSHARIEVPADRSPGESRVLADLLALRGRPAAFAERMPVDTESMLLSLARGDVRGGSDAGEGVHATSTTRPAGTAATAPGSLEPAHASSPRPTAAPTAAAPAPAPTRLPGPPVAPRSNGPGDGRPIIRAEHLTRRFGDFTAVDDLTIRVEPGSIFAFLGANGSGKSTTIRMLIGLLSPTGGEIEVDGIDVIRNPRRVRDHIGYMGQKVSLYQGLSLRENVEFYAGLYGLDDARLRERWGALSERLSLREYEASQPADLPAGVRQRAGLALSTLHQPRVLFLDEPTAGVDVHNRALFWELIGEEARAGVTVFVTTHFLEEADFCDRVCFIQSGRLEADGTPSELRERWSRGYRVRVATAAGAAPGRAAELSAFGEGAAARGLDVRRDGDGLEISAGSLDPAWMEPLGDLERACPDLRVSVDEPPMTGIFRALSGRSS